MVGTRTDRSVVGEPVEGLDHGLVEGTAAARVDEVDVVHEVLHPAVVGEPGQASRDALAIFERELPEIFLGLLDRPELVPELLEDVGHVRGTTAPARALEVAKDRRHLVVVRKSFALEPVEDDAHVNSDELRDLLRSAERSVEEIGHGDRKRTDGTGHGCLFSLDGNGMAMPRHGVLCRSIPWQRRTVTKKPTSVKENRHLIPSITPSEALFIDYFPLFFCTQPIFTKT